MQAPRFLESVHEDFPDDDTVKEVRLQAVGFDPTESQRHVLLEWDNMRSGDILVTQIIQLTGQAGNYNYYAPVVKHQPLSSREHNELFTLGSYTRAQRDQILQLASEVVFKRTSTINNCRVWTRDLLGAMVHAGLLEEDTLLKLQKTIPLEKRKPE